MNSSEVHLDKASLDHEICTDIGKYLCIKHLAIVSRISRAANTYSAQISDSDFVSDVSSIVKGHSPQFLL